MGQHLPRPAARCAPGYAALRSNPRTISPGSGTAISRRVKVVGMGSSPYRDFEPRYPVPRPVVPNSKPRPAAMTCCPPHVPPIRSGTELPYVIANPQVEHRELRPSPIIAHPKVGGPTPARITILTDGRSCSAPRNRQHTSTLPGGARHENYRTGGESVDKFAETDVADVVNLVNFIAISCRSGRAFRERPTIR